MSRMQAAAELDDDEFEQIIRIKSTTDLYAPKAESEYEDPFSKSWDEISKLEGLSTSFKRKATRMAKAYTGIDGAKSKKLDPLDLTGYSLFQIVQPPYNTLYLAQLYDINPFHHSAVNAKAANVVGLGYHFEETQRTLDKIEDVMSDDSKLDKLRRRISRAKYELRDYLESLNSDDSFLTTRFMLIWKQLEMPIWKLVEPHPEKLDILVIFLQLQCVFAVTEMDLFRLFITATHSLEILAIQQQWIKLVQTQDQMK